MSTNSKAGTAVHELESKLSLKSKYINCTYEDQQPCDEGVEPIWELVRIERTEQSAVIQHAACYVYNSPCYN